MKNNLEVVFWGVRGSYPAPGRNTLRYGGNTSCVEVRAGNERIIFDAGTGIIPLGRKISKEAAQERKEIKVSLFLSHLHHDHIQGFPFFVPAYLSSAHVQIFGPGSSDENLMRVLENNQSPQSFPISLNEMAAWKTIRAVREQNQVLLAGEASIREASQKVEGDAVLVRIHIADLVGASRKRVNQAIALFKQQDLIAMTEKGRIKVCDRDSLANYC